MLLKRVFPFVLASLFAASGPAAAHTFVYTGTFSAEVSGGTGTGNALVTIDSDIFTMRVQADFSGLSSDVSVAHIHCCTTTPGTGNAGVASIFPSFTNFPAGAGVRAGTYDFTYDMSLLASYNAPFVTANGGTATSAFNALIVGLNERRGYFNIHTVTFPAGEIRAILTPEPSASALVLLSFLALGYRARSRKAH
jgi:hypothetical protein